MTTTATEPPPIDEAQVYGTIEALLAELGSPIGRVEPGSDLERDLGLGSLERAELITRLERLFETTLPDRTLVDARTPDSLLDALADAVQGGGARVVRRERDSAADGDAPARWGCPPRVHTILEAARWWATVEPDRVAVRVLADDGEPEPLSYGALWQRALRVGGGLAASGVEQGDRVALILPTGADFFAAFLGVWCAGAVPVPIYPPIRLDEIAAYLERHGRLLRNAGTRAIVTDKQLAPVGGLLRDRVPEVIAVSTVRELETHDHGFGAVHVEPEDLGLIQYSSGSTGDPKGVSLPHAALFANTVANGIGLELGPEDVRISWLPLYHDMGLIGSWLTAYVHGVPLVILSPLQFLSRPERWLWAFHTYRGTVAPAPNFGFDLCVKKIADDQIEGVDLSSWSKAMNGSEPIQPQTIDSFCERFGPYGFRREAMMPVYGLAETSVGLAFNPVLRGPKIDAVERAAFLDQRRAEPATDGQDALQFISCGRVLQKHEVRVVEPGDIDGAPLSERSEGRIQFRGPSSMRGYFNRPDASEAVMRGEWIDTGDLGYLADGELYVTGRVKDLVIKGGRKYHPQDIEQAAQTVQGVRKGCAVAFAAPDDQGRESIVVLCETREPAPKHAELTTAVNRAVQDYIGTPPDRVMFLPPRTVLKTSSGKLRRRETRQRYLDGTLLQAPPARWRTFLSVALGSAPARLGQAGRRTGQVVYGAYALAVYVGSTLLACLLLGYFVRTERGAHRVARGSMRLSGFLTGLSAKRSGGSIPTEGPRLVVCNHASYFDPYTLLTAIDEDLTFTPKAPVFDWPLLGKAMVRMGNVKVERRSSDGRLDSYKAAAEAVAAGKLVQIFPEGTFSSATGIRPFRLGAFQIAAETGATIIPIAVKGTRQALRANQSLFRRVPVEVIVLDPIQAKKDGGFREVTRLRDAVRAAIAEAVGEPVLDIRSAALPPGTEVDA